MKSIDNVKNLIGAAIGTDSSIEQFMKIVEIPDEQFDLFYPELNKKITEIFESKTFQTEILKTLEQNPIENFEEETKLIQDVMNDIKNEDSLSENKKKFIVELLDKSILSVYKYYENPRERVKVKVKKLTEDAILPTYAHTSDTGADVYANEETIVPANGTVIVKTGISVAVPVGYDLQVRPRSGMSLKTPIRIANAPGSIDASYRGEVGVIAHNTSNEDYKIEKGTRIAQLVIAPSPMIEWDEVEELDETKRGSGGYGSTGE